MENSSTREKVGNMIMSILVVTGLYIFCAYYFDFFYELNDDMVIKDILSGGYSGTPSGHTNQMLYPIGLFLSCCYRILPRIPFFALFLCGSMGLCFGLIHYRIQDLFKNLKGKVIAAIFLFFVFLTLMLWEIVYVQYSVVCGILSGTACFWFYTTPVESSEEEFWKSNIWALGLVWLAFMIRSEMLLLTGPFIAAVGIWHWAEFISYQKRNNSDIGRKTVWDYLFSKKSIKKYIKFAAVFLVGLIVMVGADALAFWDESWQQYRKFFDARTAVYDYTWYPEYEQEKEFYQENGISEIQYQLIDSYNFGLDETITDHTLETIASFEEKSKMTEETFHLKALGETVKRMFSGQDKPYNYFVMAAYGLVLGLAVVQKDRSYLWKVSFLLVMRTIPWFYLIYVQRALDRITHPLYMVELFILIAMLTRELYDRPLWNAEKYYRLAVAGVYLMLIIATLPSAFQKVKTEQIRREETLKVQMLWDEYAKSNPKNYYYMDVYSTVSFMEKMFADVDRRQKNYDLLGGWVCHSPLQKEARSKYLEAGLEEKKNPQDGKEETSGAKTIAEALLLNNFYFVAEKNCDVSFLENFYDSRKMPVILELKDTVGEGENPFHVYRVLLE